MKLEVTAKPSSSLSRVSTMERLIVDTPAGNLTMESGKVYILPQTIIDQLSALGAPIWTLK